MHAIKRLIEITFLILTLFSLYILSWKCIDFFGEDKGGIDFQTICTGNDAVLCVPPLREFNQKYRVVNKFNLLACAIEKNFSTMLTAIFCYLHRESEFLENNRTLLREGYKNRFCRNHNEFVTLSEAMLNLGWNTLTKNAGMVAIVRNPVQRFISGFTDKCLRERTWERFHSRCAGCKDNMTCFMERLYRNMLKYSSGLNSPPTFDQMHFFPQNWRCEFHSHLRNYTILHYDTEKASDFLSSLIYYLEQYGVPETSLEYIRSEMSGGRTKHATVNMKEREEAHQKLLGSPYLLSLLVKMYFYDFVLFGYELPQITTSTVWPSLL